MYLSINKNIFLNKCNNVGYKIKPVLSKWDLVELLTYRTTFRKKYQGFTIPKFVAGIFPNNTALKQYNLENMTQKEIPFTKQWFKRKSILKSLTKDHKLLAHINIQKLNCLNEDGK